MTEYKRSIASLAGKLLKKQPTKMQDNAFGMDHLALASSQVVTLIFPQYLDFGANRWLHMDKLQRRARPLLSEYRISYEP